MQLSSLSALPAKRRARSEGFSLVELMVAMTISLVLLAGLVTLVINADNNQAKLTQVGAANDNGSYAMGRLVRNLRLAGFYGMLYSPTAPTTLPAACQNPPAPSQSDLGIAVQGYSRLASSDPLPNCVPAAQWASGTPILIVRRAATTPTAQTTPMAPAGQYYIQSNNSATSFGTPATFTLLGNDYAGNPRQPPAVRAFEERIYFISSCLQPDSSGDCTSSSDNNNPIPTLKEVDLTNSGGKPAWSTPLPIASGIQQMQVDYGVDSNGDGVPDSYMTPGGTTSMTLANWEHVVTVRISLLVRSEKKLRGWTDTKTYQLGGTPSSPVSYGPYNDEYVRHVFTQVVRLTNVDQRLE